MQTSDQTMPRITMLEDDQASTEQFETFQRARRRYGWLPNTIRVMTRSSSAGRLYLDAGQRNEETSLTEVERELVAVATATHNRCEYCLSAHSVNAMALGASREDVREAREGASNRARRAAILAFVRAVLAERGAISDEELAAATDAGLDESTLVDLVAVVAENVLGNYVNNLADTPTDPLVTRAAARLDLQVRREVPQ